jgi:dienelactone hydrolase
MSETTTGPAAVERRHFEVSLPGSEPPIRGDVRLLHGTEPRSAVVICHGFKGFREWGFFPALARALAVRGHAAISFDFSRNGVGADGVDFSALDLFAENTHSRNLDEIHTVVDVLMRRQLLPHAPRRLGLFGHSRGGGEAVLAAAEEPRVDALVTTCRG